MVLNDIRTVTDLGNLYWSHWAGEGRDGFQVAVKRKVYLQIENLPYLGLINSGHHKLQNKRGLPLVYKKRAVICSRG